MQYTQPYDEPSSPNASYVNGDPTTGTQGSIIPAGALEPHQRELVALITAAGITASGADLQQVLRAIRSGVLNFYNDTGSADALAIAPSPAYTSLPAGTELVIQKGANPNATTTPTLLVNALAAMTIVRFDGTALAEGDLPGDSQFVVRSDGTALRVQGFVTSLASPYPHTALVHAGVDTSTTNGQLTVTVAPAIAAYNANDLYLILPHQDCTGATVANVNAIGNRNVVRSDGAALQAGDYKAGKPLLLADDGSSLRFVSPAPSELGGVQTITTSGAFTIHATDRCIGLNRTSSPAASSATLPASGVDVGHEIEIADLAGNFNSYPVTINTTGGQTIAGLTSVVLNVNRQVVRLRYYGGNIWSVRL